ncbi:MAG: DUF1538 domain-containing protein [Oscillospiraceae bacterium]|nr:DUF1538 domain-containing protein [Oscillospiraceae bacterium]
MLNKILESFSSVLPIIVIVFILSVSIAPITGDMFFKFFVGTAFLIIGIGLFTIGVDQSLVLMGEEIGSKITRFKKLWIILPAIFIIGFFVAVAEPDLNVLASQVAFVEKNTLIMTVALSVGTFLAIAFLRIFLQIKMARILSFLYIIILAIVLSPMISEDFIPVAFDSGGVATGPVVVPFIVAIGLGLSFVRDDKTQQEDSFGLVGLCAIGPIAATLLLGMFTNNADKEMSAELVYIQNYDSVADVFHEFLVQFPHYFLETGIAIAPILVLFFIFNFIILKLDKQTIIKILVGLLYTYLGLVLFFTGVNVGFIPTGQFLGGTLAKSAPLLLIPIGMIIGFFIVSAEPAVIVLKQQVENVTDGAITGKGLGRGLSIGIAISVGLAMIRVLSGISILWFLIPGYAFALVMTLFVPPVYTSIAIDSGAVASGPMTVTFSLPLALGASQALGGNIAADAFGLVAMVSMTPFITIQLLGFISIMKKKRTKPLPVPIPVEADEIVDLTEED